MRGSFLAVLATVANYAQADTCYALAFGAGDETAAYQAGVLRGLVSHNGAEMHQYDTVTGVQGGAVNAALLAAYPAGQEAEAADRMVNFWQHASSSELYKDWLGGVAEGVLLKEGLFNNAPLEQFLTEELADIASMQRSVHIGLTDVLAGTFEVQVEENLNDNLLDIMFASFADPGYYPPAESMGHTWFDGAVVWDLDIFSAVNKCLETHEPKDIVLDVVLTHEKTLQRVDAADWAALHLLWRFKAVSRYYNAMDALLRAQFAYPDIQWRYIVSPSEKLSSNWIPLNESPDQIEAMVSLGESDAVEAIKNLEAGETEDTLHYFALKKNRDKRIKGVSFEEFKTMRRNNEFEGWNEARANSNLSQLFLS